MERKWIADCDGRRDNNFTLLRILFAWMVIYSHAFALQPANGAHNPLYLLLRGSTSAGEIAVNGFFAISGFLVCGSLVKRGVRDYAISRALRIYPALAICVALCALGVGPLFTSLELGAYLRHPATLDYLHNALGFGAMRWPLPGVFEQNASSTVNGSLWTITVELRCYLLLAIAGLMGLLRTRWLTNLAALSLLGLGWMRFEWLPLIGQGANWGTPTCMFLIGVGIYTNRRNIPLDGRLAILATAVVLSSFGRPWFGWAFPLPFAYLVFYLAYATPFIDLDRRVGDVSYGVYIFAFPIQQSVAALWPAATPFENVLVTTSCVFPIAWLSWRAIESPALSLKARFMGDRPRSAALRDSAPVTA